MTTTKIKTISKVSAILVALFFGVGGILPALAKAPVTGGIPAAFIPSYTLGVFLLSCLGAGAVFHVIRRRDPS
jgi:hypothetical protein